jgi:hypothetical protein
MRSIAIAALAVLLVCTSTYAETKNNPISDDAGGQAGDLFVCDLTDYTSINQVLGVDIPDGSPVGTGLLGPIQFTDNGSVIVDAIVEIDLTHTWVGDLRVFVYYDGDCNGTPDIGPVALLCRQDLALCEPDGCCGCSGDLTGPGYVFSDSSPDELGDPDCPSAIPPACFHPALESPNPLSVFDAENRGACFWIEAFDGAGADVGTLNGWTVHLLDSGGATPVEAASWGTIKGTY